MTPGTQEVASQVRVFCEEKHRNCVLFQALARKSQNIISSTVYIVLVKVATGPAWIKGEGEKEPLQLDGHADIRRKGLEGNQVC